MFITKTLDRKTIGLMMSVLQLNFEPNPDVQNIIICPNIIFLILEIL